MVWYCTTERNMISVWWDIMPGWCIITMKVYDITIRYISITWCISARWYISMTWHDSSMNWYRASNYHDFLVFWPFGVWPFGVRVFWVSVSCVLTRPCRCIEEIYSCERLRTTKRVRYCQGGASSRCLCAMIQILELGSLQSIYSCFSDS